MKAIGKIIRKQEFDHLFLIGHVKEEPHHIQPPGLELPSFQNYDK